jgi:SAM-dependent methyltransferase
MPSLYEALRGAYRLLPAAVRGLPLLERVSGSVAGSLAPHDLIYTEEYYANDIEGHARRAAPAFARLITDEFQPACVIDVGCGTGAMLEGLARRGCRCIGLEYAEAGLAYCRSRGVDAQKFNIEADVWTGSPRAFDVALSMEVAEHLPERLADRYVDLLTGVAPVVVLTAAPPGQGGTDHVNEQPRSYWIEKFAARGYHHETGIEERWGSELKGEGVVGFYINNLMVFRKPVRS